jgi:hypothetical protein
VRLKPVCVCVCVCEGVHQRTGESVALKKVIFVHFFFIF